ncbi:hypothetical protein [Candidatus Epulonipiscium viviparus]|uniref:hypothetical protein n=1 Tax=Candidatus Epulonipiscium viviparus TaxID=420336 RepID=UPI000496247B|nr:hypothetical protein [Candidatus Epulopiscium viviparus]
MNINDINNSILKDSVYYFNKILLGNCGNEITLENGTYDLRVTYANERFFYMTNNDFGLKNVAFPIYNKKNLVIDGNGARLNGIGRICPFYIYGSENITLKNFVIDYERPFFSQGEVVAAADDEVVIKIDQAKYPYQIKSGVLSFVGTDYSNEFVHGILEFSKQDKRPLADAVDNGVWGPLVVEELEPGLLKIKKKFRKLPNVGSILSIKHEQRYVPAISIDSSKNIRLENITVYHAGTMGVVAQFTENITLNNFKVSIEPGSDRVVSANADATHFVGCSGDLVVTNSLFENQLDDILNVHGNYLRVHAVVDSTNVIAEIPHRQQVGAFSLKVGAKIGIYADKTMVKLSETAVKSIHVINNKFYEIEFTDAFEFAADQGYCIEDLDSYPTVTFTNNKGGKNRARGLLLTSAKDILIANNELYCEGAAIKISADMTGWYESGATNSVIIKDNILSRRNTKTWGKALIDIDPEMEEFEGYFHGNITIENNQLIVGDFPLIYGGSIDTLQIKNNNIIGSKSEIYMNAKQIKNLEIEGNTFS